MAIYGYARVSTTDQDLGAQVDALEEYGCTIIRREKVSGASRDGRKELDTLLEFMREGDTLVVYKLDRLGRSTRDVLNIVHELDQKGCFLKVIDRDIDTSRPEGQLILTVLSMVSQMELQFIKERQKVGIKRAKARGVYKGRPATIPVDRIHELKAQGMGATAIARELGCTRGAIYKAINRSDQQM